MERPEQRRIKHDAPCIHRVEAERGSPYAPPDRAVDMCRNCIENILEHGKGKIQEIFSAMSLNSSARPGFIASIKSLRPPLASGSTSDACVGANPPPAHLLRFETNPQGRFVKRPFLRRGPFANGPYRNTRHSPWSVIPTKAGMTAKTRNRAETQALALKTNPPYPPLSGGQEKTKAPLPAAGAAFSYPPDKGG